MKSISIRRLQPLLSVGLILLTFICPAYAKSINLYDQPAPNAKIIEAIDLTTGIMPIFAPKGGEWVKVADPKNGNVGWVKANDLRQAGIPQTTFIVKESTQTTNPSLEKINKSMRDMLNEMTRVINEQWKRLNETTPHKTP